MTVEQTVEIPASHRLVIDVPREVPAGRVVLAFTPEGETHKEPACAGEGSRDTPEYLRAPDIPETMLLCEAALAKEWDNPEEDEAWAGL